MGEVFMGIVVLITLVAWIILIGFLMAEKREREFTALNNMRWARNDERIILQHKVNELPVASDMYGEASVRLEDVLAIIYKGSRNV